jgi:hypothetical protein
MRLLRQLPRWKQAIALFYTGAISVIFLKAGSPDEILWWPAMVLFLGWCLAPILVPLMYAPKMVANGIAIAGVAAYSIYVYATDMFGPGARSTSALIFIFLPLYQWGAAILVILIGMIESSIKR